MRPTHIATAVALVLCLSTAARSHDVHLTLNIFPTSNAAPNAGGTWALYARTNTPNGIAAIFMNLAGIDPNSLVFAANVNQDPLINNPAALPGGIFHIVYAQDVFADVPVAYGVGYPTFTPGPDPLGDPAFANMTKILSGTYTTNVPAFAEYSGDTADSNVFKTGGPTFTGVDPANTTFDARLALSGDYNADGAIDAADYVAWRKGITPLPNDNTPGNDPTDFTRWKTNFGEASSGGGSSSPLHGAIPEPMTASLLAAALLTTTVIASAYRSRRFPHIGHPIHTTADT